MNQTPIHNTIIERDIAIPLVLVGKISEIKTQGIGPNEVPKQPTNPKIKIKTQGPVVSPK